MIRTFFLDAEHARDRMVAIWRIVNEYLLAGKDVRIRIDEKQATRTLEQNDKLNAMCGDLADQVEWYGQYLSRDDWRHMFVASYRKGQRVVPGFDGGFIVLGASSRSLSISECSDIIEMMYAFGVDKSISWRMK